MTAPGNAPPVDDPAAARREARAVLHACATAQGFTASAAGGLYPQVWARDGVITVIAAGVLNDPLIRKASLATLRTLRDYQGPLGRIPNNVDPSARRVDAMNSGAIDANSWYVLGVAHRHRQASDPDLAEFWLSLERAITWLLYQDSNDDGLLEQAEAADWADLLPVRHNGLYANVLFAAALRAGGDLARRLGHRAEARAWSDRAREVADRINQRLWLDPAQIVRPLARARRVTEEWQVAYLKALVQVQKLPYYLPFLAFRDVAVYCDAFGNLLAILTGVASRERADKILDFMESVGMDQPFPLKAIHPPIQAGDREWRDYFRTNNLNLPHQYHNGGIWPFLGGWYVAALVHVGRIESARRALEALTEANRAAGRVDPKASNKNDPQASNQDGAAWEFNEWLHGETGRPMGSPRQAWSAALWLLADAAVTGGAVPPLFGGPE